MQICQLLLPSKINRSGLLGSKACLINLRVSFPAPSIHVCSGKTVSKSYQELDSSGTFLQRTFPFLDERAHSTDGQKEALRDSGTFPCSNSPPGGWQGSGSLLTTAPGCRPASGVGGEGKEGGTRSPQIWSLVSPLSSASNALSHLD